jgi:hypothetical protein
MASSSCLPPWHAALAAVAQLGKAKVKSGCATVDGNVQCSPEDMRARAERDMVAAGWWPAGKPLSLATYTLARYMQGEVGSGTVEEAVAVGEAAVNRAALEHLPRGVLDLLLYRQKTSSPNYGRYGPIHKDGDVTQHPYGRWATTSADPTVAMVVIADAVLNGDARGFNQGADDQNGMQYAAAFPNPERSIELQAAKGDYWVGPLPGVDPWHTTLYRHYGYAANSPEGRALVARANAFFGARKCGATKDGRCTRWVSTLPQQVAQPCRSSLLRNVLVGLGVGAAVVSSFRLVDRRVAVLP